QRFKLITLFHVFEHLSEPKRVIEKLKEVLADDGLLVMTMPNGASHQAKKYRNHWFHLDPPRHLHLIPPKTLISSFQQQGFQLIEENYKSFFYNPYGYVQSALNRRSKQRDFLYEHIKRGSKGFFSNIGLQLLGHWLYAAFAFPFFVLKDTKESKEKKSACFELVFKAN
ncbi:MAG: class I SAM-dependent methyltransferase, partial [Cyanobacteria bacterium J06649_11]